jgi:1,4-alpha-glucan branching enzyme
MKLQKLKSTFVLFTLFLSFTATSQIYDPEGLNMPGDWDSWFNPPANLVFASATQASGNVILINDLGQSHYQTVFSEPTNITTGAYGFKFTSGPNSGTDIWKNQWGNVTVIFNSIQTYTYGDNDNSTPVPEPSMNSIVVNSNKYYVMNWENLGYVDTRAIFMELDAAPVTITDVTQNISVPNPLEEVIITVTTDNTPVENVYVRYTTDGWISSDIASCVFSGTSGDAVIPGQDEGTDVEYYVFTTSFTDPVADFDLITITHDNNNGLNYQYSVPEPLSCEGQTGVLTTDPLFPLQEGSVLITFDATLGNGGLAGYTGDVYAHTGVITSESNGNNDWRYVVTDWGVNTPETMFTNIGDDLFELSISNIRDFYGVPANEDIYKIAMVVRSGEPIIPEEPDNFYVARNADGTDLYIDIYDEGLNVKLYSPDKKDPLVPLNTLIPVCAAALDATTVYVYIDDVLVHQEDALEIMYELNTGDYDPGMHEIVAEASDGTESAYDTTYFYIRGDVVVEELPPGVSKGINYLNDNEVTLVLHDPAALKEYAFVIGDFNNWTASDEGYMKRTVDGQYYWLTLSGLNSGTEYAYQYYIDGELKIADPYCDKVLDPWNDRWIPETTYPELKEYPWDQTIGIVSVIETGQEEYDWIIDDFTPVAVNATQSNLIIYELLIRDFVESRDIKDVIDSLDYLQKLGINAIELMPVNEFDGNDSWGYNPAYYFATDKAYGTKNDYKNFIDECHQRGIAVILDVVYNHSFGQSPFVQMYNEGTTGPPTPDNPWLNSDADPGTPGYQACHPYNVGYDFNHESPHTRQMVKDNLEYWITEFKIDGFRFDLTKGFTQTYSGDDVGYWSQYDQSRVAILNDYYNHIKSLNSNAYVIFEHLAENDEEIVLANSGVLLWGVMNEQFNQNTMGWDSNHDFSWANYENRGFTYPNLIPYMESHDEERIMFRNLAYGNGFADDTTASLSRTEAIVPMYMSIPGPKMIWQFGELGYDESIELCSDGTYDHDCRIVAKPLHWEYMNDIRRQKLYWIYAGMAKLKTENEAFRNGTFGEDQSGLGKRLWINHASLNVSVSANFATTAFDMAPGFQHTGTWYNYFTGEEINVTDAGGHTVFYEPGDYYVFTDVDLGVPFAELTFNVKNEASQNLDNATVRIHSYSTALTDTEGNAQFIYGSNNELSYTVHKDGYFPESGTVMMPENNHLVNIILEEDGNDINKNKKDKVLLFPNPASKLINIKADNLKMIHIYDCSGKTVNTIYTESSAVDISVSSLKSGIYFLEIKTDVNTCFKKLIIKNN